MTNGVADRGSGKRRMGEQSWALNRWWRRVALKGTRFVGYFIHESGSFILAKSLSRGFVPGRFIKRFVGGGGKIQTGSSEFINVLFGQRNTNHGDAHPFITLNKIALNTHNPHPSHGPMVSSSGRVEPQLGLDLGLPGLRTRTAANPKPGRNCSIINHGNAGYLHSGLYAICPTNNNKTREFIGRLQRNGLVIGHRTTTDSAALMEIFLEKRTALGRQMSHQIRRRWMRTSETGIKDLTTSDRMTMDEQNKVE